MKIYVALSKELNMSEPARMSRAEKLGFDVKTKWYHGGFEDFTEFDPKKSGSGTFNFTTDEKFARQYASTKSQDEERDASPIVRAFYLPKRLFNYKEKSHIKRLKAVLPDTLEIQSNYGWGAWGGPHSYTREQIIEAVQGIAIPSNGFTPEIIRDIKAGKKIIRREGGMDYVMNYDKAKGTVELVPSYVMDGIRGLKQQIELFKDEVPDSYQTILNKQKLRKYEAEFKSYTYTIHPQKKKGYDSWEFLESHELRPYLRKIGFLGCIMQEKGRETAAIFDSNNVRLVDAAFDLTQKRSSNLLASGKDY